MELENLLFHRHDRAKAVEILVKDLKVFATFNEELFKEITQLLTLENFRYIKLIVRPPLIKSHTLELY